MSFEVEATSTFGKQVKRLARKYPSLKQEVVELIQLLSREPIQGTPLGKGCYKIRMSIVSKGQGKSGGARVVTHVQVVKSKVYLLTIYDKSEVGNITGAELNRILRSI